MYISIFVRSVEMILQQGGCHRWPSKSRFLDVHVYLMCNMLRSN